jgi:hypothetical protein
LGTNELKDVSRKDNYAQRCCSPLLLSFPTSLMPYSVFAGKDWLESMMCARKLMPEMLYHECVSLHFRRCDAVGGNVVGRLALAEVP